MSITLEQLQKQGQIKVVNNAQQNPNIAQQIYQGIAGPALNLIARPVQAVQTALGQEPSTGKLLGVEITEPDIQKDFGRALETIALGIPAGKLWKLVTAGGLFGAGAAIEEGEDIFSKETVTEAGFGAFTAGGLGVGSKILGKTLSKGVQKVKNPIAEIFSKLFGYTADTAPDVLKPAILNPKIFAQAQKEVINLGNPGVLQKVQNGITQLRTDLTNYWKVGQQLIVDKAAGVKVGLNDFEVKLFNNIVNKFGIDLPKNIKSFSAKELLDLNAQINSLYSKKMIREGVEGVIVRKAKDILDNLVTKDLGKYEVGNFIKGYSAQKTVLDGMNDLFNAYKQNQPKAVAAAYRNIKAAFQEDKYAYLEVLQQFEKLTGVNVLNQLRAMQVQAFINKSGKFSMDEVFRMMFLPLTSPKLVGIEAKTLGRLLNSANSLGEFVYKLSNKIGKVGSISTTIIKNDE
jgi:hypothetical protein